MYAGGLRPQVRNIGENYAWIIKNSTFGIAGTTNSLKTAYNQCKHITPYSETA